MSHARRARLTACACALLACGGNESSVYSARKLHEERGCLEDSSAIDVVQSSETKGGCEVVCLVDVHSPLLSGAAVYVSDQCPPYPPAVDRSGTDPRCEIARAAWLRGDHCLPDGGSSNPLPAPEN